MKKEDGYMEMTPTVADWDEMVVDMRKCREGDGWGGAVKNLLQIQEVSFHYGSKKCHKFKKWFC